VPTVGWIVLFGLAMSAIALVGSTTLLLPEPKFKRVVLPLVALAAGSLLGATLFHLLPESIAELGNRLGVYAGLAAGFAVFFVLEQFLQWHHCHQPLPRHPTGPTMAAFQQLHEAATADGVLSRKTKELIALAIGISVRCDGCIAYHVHDTLDAGAGRDEVAEAIGVAVLMGGAEALTALDQFSAESAG
jgi:AhpD family alkylhydroperoxidase